jgi:tRNA-dihydrouridine synthase
MIGRTAPANPWIFRQIEQYCGSLSSGHVETALGCLVERSSTDIASAFKKREHDCAEDAFSRTQKSYSCEEPGLGPGGQPRAADPTRSQYDQPSESDRYEMIRTYFSMLIEEELPDATGKMKQFASWFTHGVPGGAALRKAIYESKTAPEILTRVEEFFETRLCGAGALARVGSVALT